MFGLLGEQISTHGKLQAGRDSGVQRGLGQVHGLAAARSDPDVGLSVCGGVCELAVVLHPLTHTLHQLQEVSLRAGQGNLATGAHIGPFIPHTPSTLSHLADGLAAVRVDPEGSCLYHFLWIHLGNGPLHLIHQSPAG